MPGVLHMSVAYDTISLLGVFSPKTWSGRVKADGSTSSARMLPSQASARSHASPHFKDYRLLPERGQRILPGC